MPKAIPPPLLSIIIINYNGKHFLDACLKSIERYILCSKEIIIVDNNSNDGSREFIQKYFPHVTLINSPKNLGFAKGNNLGVDAASAEFILLLNNDTQLKKPLVPLLTSLMEIEDFGIAGCHLIHSDSSTQPSTGYFHSPLRLISSWLFPGFTPLPKFLRLYEKNPHFYTQNHKNIDWVSGAFFLTTKNLWSKLDGFNSDIFMYLEDVDYCKRAAQIGYKSYYYACCDTVHYEAAGKKYLSEHVLTFSIDSYSIYFKKHHGHFATMATCLILASIFLGRSILLYGMGSLGMGHEKLIRSAFFRRGAKQLLSKAFA